MFVSPKENKIIKQARTQHHNQTLRAGRESLGLCNLPPWGPLQVHTGGHHLSVHWWAVHSQESQLLLGCVRSEAISTHNGFSKILKDSGGPCTWRVSKNWRAIQKVGREADGNTEEHEVSPGLGRAGGGDQREPLGALCNAWMGASWDPALPEGLAPSSPDRGLPVCPSSVPREH